MPRPRKTFAGDGGWSDIPPRQNTAPGDDFPKYGDIHGFAGLLDSCMEAGIYLGFQRGSDGGVVGIRLLDGNKNKMLWCHSQQELLNGLLALAQMYGTEDDIRLLKQNE